MAKDTESPCKRIAHCCCGGLRAETIGEPLLVVACSCGECQRRTGSAFGISAFWSRKDVELSGVTTRYVRDGQEGRKVIFYFCPQCGSSIYWEPELAPELIGIAGGAFFDPDFPTPTVATWEQSKHSWVAIPAATHLPRGAKPPPIPD
jgi:hypothetical protein